jgi:hypothetical protein
MSPPKRLLWEDSKRVFDGLDAIGANFSGFYYKGCSFLLFIFMVIKNDFYNYNEIYY